MSKKPRPSTSSGKSGWQQVFLRALAQIPNIAYGCRKAHVDRTTVHRHRKAKPEFEQQIQDALKAGIEGLEESCWKRANDGVARGVWRNDADGNPVKVETVKEYSDTLAICLLKAHVPDKYRERNETALVGADGESMPIIGIRVVGGKVPEKKDGTTKVAI